MSSTEKKVEPEDYPKVVGKRFFATGSVVRWKGSLYIVGEWIRKNSKGEESLRLLSMSSPNSSATPSESWPSYEEGINAVEVVASSVKDYILKNFSRVIWPGL